jgi:hypothetical protein
MATDSLDPHGLYFGTRTGQIFGSADEGKTWKKILDGLPAVVCVKAAVVGEPRPSRTPKLARAAAAHPSRTRRASVKKKKIRGRKR